MSLNPATYAEALERAQSRPKKPRMPLKRAGIKKQGVDASRCLNASGKLEERKASRKKRKSAADDLRKRVWKQFSIFIRRSAADENGVVQCVTCPARHLWNSGQIQAGHWMHGRLDFDERNVHPQCVPCNYHWNTKVSAAYAIFMAKTYGVEGMEELQLLANTKGNRYSRDELEAILKQYKALNSSNSTMGIL